ncbi:MAG: undecaprenyldiphospho-muramoylpentapeptide beta-N-acetylglucosaminyltransferase [Acidobacteria bacterium]|nr:undecaprenyldiphospho-muramoylpentapeptide beta-N-acetylglucosaminyltransferase [Acidobacteriota bacterium]
MKVVFAGGGTGGHVFLGIALARELLRRDPEHEFLFIGTARGMESQIVPREGFKVEYIDAGGLKRVGPVSFLRNLLRVPRAILQSRRLLSEFKPHVVVGVGGYSSGPVVLAGRWHRIPTLIVEPNAVPGFTNRILARFVDRAALAMPEASGYFGAKSVVTGIPVRAEFGDMPSRDPRAPVFTVLVYGGSRGSRALNTIVCSALPLLKDLGPRLRIIHQTGKQGLECVRAAYAQAGVEGCVQPFFERIYEQFAQADLIVARAGAGTVAEITAAGRGAILVPFPGAADDHQTRNARALESEGAARMIPERDLQPSRLVEEIRRYMYRPEELAQMEDASRRLGRPDAASKIADLIESLAARRQSGRQVIAQQH